MLFTYTLGYLNLYELSVVWYHVVIEIWYSQCCGSEITVKLQTLVAEVTYVLDFYTAFKLITDRIVTYIFN